MPVIFTAGDVLQYPAKIRVNPVNCVGAMGAGLALQFKKRYPAMVKWYKLQCREQALRIGTVMFFHDTATGDIILNVPTKEHWRNPSREEYIVQSLQVMKDLLRYESSQTVVAMPLLGCGLGGLQPERVRELIRKYLSHAPCQVVVLEHPDHGSQITP